MSTVILIFFAHHLMKCEHLVLSNMYYSIFHFHIKSNPNFYFLLLFNVYIVYKDIYTPYLILPIHFKRPSKSFSNYIKAWNGVTFFYTNITQFHQRRNALLVFLSYIHINIVTDLITLYEAIYYLISYDLVSAFYFPIRRERR